MVSYQIPVLESFNFVKPEDGSGDSRDFDKLLVSMHNLKKAK
jgi:hypothetical protein